MNIEQRKYLEYFTHDVFFDTLVILGAHSGTSEASGIINHHGRALHGDSKTTKCCQMHKLLSTVIVFPLYTDQQSVSPSMQLSDTLSSSDAKTCVWISTEGTEAVPYN